MIISHWGVIPGMMVFDPPDPKGGAYCIVWQPLDFATWCDWHD